MAEEILKEIEQVYSYHNKENITTSELSDEQKWSTLPGAYHIIKNDISKEA